MTEELSSHSLHYVALQTDQRRPLLAGAMKPLAEWGIRNLPARFPGLKVVRAAVEAQGVQMLLDFQRLDEDVLRVLQSFKLEVKNLAKKKGLAEDPFWQWNYEDRLIASSEEMREIEKIFPGA
jgi:hypothetical protein